MKFLICILFIYSSATFLSKKTYAQDDDLTPIQIINLAKILTQENKFDMAEKVLRKSSFNVKELEIERLFLIGQIYVAEKKYDDAITIFKFILDKEPTLARIRLELALAYMQKKSWYRADYHLRLASSEELPPEVSTNIRKLLYIIRQNKNWNLWFNIGAAPDNNINNASGGEECVMTMFGVLCRPLPDAQQAIGFNVSFGGNYELKFGEQFRWKNDFYTSITKYDDRQYDDFSGGFSSGPKWVYSRGEIWLAGTANRRWLNHSPYSYGIGLRLDLSYDFTKRLSGSISFRYTPTFYDEYKMLDGDTKSVNATTSYTINSAMYVLAKVGFEKETTDDELYTNSRSNFAIGFGAELPYGFTVYVEPSLMFQNYDNPKMFVKDLSFIEIKQEDITQKYSISITNKKLDLFGFTPSLRYWFTKRDSNIWQREYDKHSVDISIAQRF